MSVRARRTFEGLGTKLVPPLLGFRGGMCDRIAVMEAIIVSVGYIH